MSFLKFPEHLSAEVMTLARPLSIDTALRMYHLDLARIGDTLQHAELDVPDYLLRANRQRKQEFYVGRLLAQSIVQQDFARQEPITCLQCRLPLWPAPLLGSISHSKDQLLVAVSDTGHCLGVDIEHWVDGTFARDSAGLILTESELQLWHAGAISGLSFSQYVTLLFSMKESLYKAVYPVAQHYIDFLEAALVDIHLQQQKAKLCFCDAVQQRYGLFGEYEGGYKMEQDYLITWIFKAKGIQDSGD
ncbi:4'-phosphopantetheinyl transferase family protein [Acinetobacter sp. WZC-1]|uniref:4'-phosphopantetheinyl transferase family protein n=1 Tax=Acinetobacter sp. WZC-1 TaxID=3459034 RepID=UPI00403DAB08